jgi:sirohydrochlorin cobaltochelatase
VLPYFLFEGVLVEQLAGEVAAYSARHPDIDVRLAKHLGIEERLLGLMEDRLGELLEGGDGLPGDACPRLALGR